MLNQRILLFISILALTGFLLVALFRSNLVEMDVTLNTWSASIQTSSFTIVAVAISNVFDTYIVIAISLFVAAILCLKNYKRYSVLLFYAVAGEILIVTATKTLIASPRPVSEILLQTGYSFPSGHVTGSIVFFGLLTYFTWQIWKTSFAKAVSSSLFLLVTCIVAFDRIYLNVHWLSDIVGATLLGTFWLASVLLVFRHVETAKYFRNC